MTQHAPLTIQEQIDAIYNLLLAQERARKNELRFAIVRRVVIYGFFGYMLLHPTFFIERSVGLVQPVIMKTIGDLYSQNQGSIQQILEQNIEKYKE